MECTQRLESLTQEVYESRQERTNSEQIGFLGICGTKYPILRGPNKIGRDPQTCNIVLDLNSISRQHAVINVLNSKEYMIMDLDSANKTKLLNKSLQPYIPHPLRNGDTLQFGQIFGIFRLLEDDDELPMTQALEIPDTPVVNRHVTKLNSLPSTTIPESPDCSDKDESFIASSQAKNQDVFKSPNSHFTKKMGKTIAIQPVGGNKIDNAYWKSTKKSVSIDMSLDDSNEDIVGNIKSLTTVGSDTNEDIHDMDTQVPYLTDKLEMHDAIHTADTQFSTDGPSISGLDNHLIKMNNLPIIQKTNKQQEMKLDLFTENKENNNSLFNAETQLFDNIIKTPTNNENTKESNEGTSNPNFNISDEEIIFDEVDSQPLPDNFGSQPLLPENLFDGDIEEKMESKTNDGDVKKEIIIKDKKTNRTRLNSDSSTDCDDFEFLPTQKIPEEPNYNEEIKSLNKPSTTTTTNDSKLVNTNDDITDCEDNIMETNTKADPIKSTCVNEDDNDSTDCEDDIIPCNSDAFKKKDEFEDLATQVITVDKPSAEDNSKDKSLSDFDFEDMPTQVIEEADIENTSKISDDFCFEDLPTQVLPVETSKELVKQNNIPTEDIPFKIPLSSVKKNKKKEITKPNLANSARPELMDDNFYNATQEILNDLCTQNESNTEIEKPSSNNGIESKMKEASSKKILLPTFVLDKSSESSDGDEKINKFVKTLSHSQIKDIVGIGKQKTEKQTNATSDSSDLETTPKKPIRFMETDLPNSQEIRKSVSLKTAKTFVVSSSDSEPEEVQECTSVISHKNKPHKNPKIELSKKFENELLPTRLLTRVRKPTAKAQDSNIDLTKMIRSRLVAGSEENIDTEIIMENMLRLKTKTSKHKTDEGTRKSNEANNENKHKQEIEDFKPVGTKLPDPINNKKSDEKIDAKGKPDVSGKRKNVKAEEDNDKKRKKSNSHDDTTKLSDSRTRNDKKSINVKKDDKAIDKRKEDIIKSDKTSEKPSRRSPRTIEKGHVDKKEEKTQETSESKSSSKHVKTQKEESKQTSKDNKDSNVKNSRTTRSRGKEAIKKEEPKSSAKEKVETDKRDKRKRNSEESAIETSDKEMRRSKRQKTIKSYLEPNPIQHSNKTSTGSRSSKHEQSTVYNISAGSSNETTPKEKSANRKANDDEVVNVKKKSPPILSRNTSLRSTPRNIKTHKVLFTAFPSEEVKDKLIQLGAVIVNELAECTVLLTLQIKRTFKLLCAIGLGRPIVGPSWVQACVDTKMIVDPWLYIIKDEASEKRFQFNLGRTLTGRRNFLQGYNVSSTPSIVPKPSEMKLIVENSGGTWKEGGSKWVCITCNSDKNLWLSIKRKGAVLVSTEFILEGVLQQKLNIEKHRLS